MPPHRKPETENRKLYLGQAVANALELTYLLNPGRPLPVPPGLLAAFPRLAETVMGEKDGEGESC